jgi:ATP synthase in type III secretion protein N
MASDFDKFLTHLEEVELTSVHGRITEVVGMLIKAVIPEVKMGEVCLIKREGEPLMAEVIGFTKEEVFLSPLGEMTGIGPASEVIPMRMPLHIKVGPELLGRVLNGRGEPLDTDEKGPLHAKQSYSIMRAPPDPLKRMLVEEPIHTGVRAIDGVLTTGKGQRMGIFAGAGVGKSTLLGMIARNAQADVNVIALIGERGCLARNWACSRRASCESRIYPFGVCYSSTSHGTLGKLGQRVDDSFLYNFGCRR